MKDKVTAWLMVWIRWSGQRDIAESRRLDFKPSGLEYKFMVMNGTAPKREVWYRDDSKAEVVDKLWNHFFYNGFEEEMAAVRIWAKRGFSISAVRKELGVTLTETRNRINHGKHLIEAGLSLLSH